MFTQEGSIMAFAAQSVLQDNLLHAPALVACSGSYADRTCQFSETCILLCLGFFLCL